MNKSNKYIVIHGHFYQPPRENAWLEIVELQDSAQPFHDWNERINFECYAPNASARILDKDGQISKIKNNYVHLNFNFGPTLLSWMEQKDPDTYLKILEADKISQEKHDGHGSAIAQAHSHLILPLCNAKDQETQVIWGIRDFEHRFGRKPEGMWLAETAVNTDVLEVMATHGIKYTILAPRQAKAFRKIGDHDWQGVNHDLDTRRPYLAKLPSGKSIALFVYDGNIAQDVAFNGLLNNGKGFANRFIEAFDNNDTPQVVNVATDGESYGHHHRYGEMALADAINHIKENNLATMTNYGQYLELFPPEYELMIHENSSWSCVHGVERWRSNCGCNTGGRGNWTQAWRSTLRDTLNWLRDQILPIYLEGASKLLKDPWIARNDYVEVLLNRNDETVDAFLEAHAIKKLDKAQKTEVLRMLEMQRNAMLMFTSCGWFFDEISGLETNQILQYACRAIYYANQISGAELQDQFIKKMSKGPSNVYADAAFSYINHVLPTRVDLIGAGMHYAVSSLFEKEPEKLRLFNYIATSEAFTRESAGNERISIGRTMMKSRVTYSEKHFTFVVIHLGQQNIIGNISIDMDKKTYQEMHDKIISAFQNTQLGEVIGLMQTYFGSNKYSFQHLFRDEKRKILKEITRKNLRQAEASFRDIYNDNYQLMTSSLQSNIPIPKAYNNVVQFIVNADMHRFFTQDDLNIEELKRLSKELKKWDIKLGNEQSFILAASERIFYEVRQIVHADAPIEQMNQLIAILEVLDKMEFESNIWKSQNLYFSALRNFRKGRKKFLNNEWKAAFFKLGKLLKVEIVPELFLVENN